MSQVIQQDLLTWLDVERSLKLHTSLWSTLPQAILGIECYPNVMEIRHVGNGESVKSWLSGVFGTMVQEGQDGELVIKLAIPNASYPVEFFQEEIAPVRIQPKDYPLWSEVTYLPTELGNGNSPVESSATAQFDLPPDWTDGPDLISFHSFKGGVGRTTSLMTYVAACMENASPGAKKILVVDADLEAPGVSFWLDASNTPTVSFVQFLEALHYPPAGRDASLDYFAQELRKTSVNVHGLQRQLFVLPAALRLQEIQDMPVKPEHIARNPSNPWQLSDDLRELGRRLNVDAIFIDLRAGLSELASPVLFDPRIDHFMVSTVAPQSVQGMAEVLRRLHAFNLQLPSARRAGSRPSVVLSLLTKELRESAHYENAIRVLGESYPSEDALTPAVQWLEAGFQNSLMSIGTVREALDSLPKNLPLFGNASEWAEALYSAPLNGPVSTSSAVSVDSTSRRREQASRLIEVCTAAEFADSRDATQILATEPLLNLGKHYSVDLPNLLMIGAKGAGKTFTFRQVVKSQTWDGFLTKLGFAQEGLTEAAIFPVLWSSNMTDSPEGDIKLAQYRALGLIGVGDGPLMAASLLKRRIAEAVVNPPAHWEDFWDELIASQLGTVSGGLRALNESLAEKNTKLVLVFDGIEDAFADANDGQAPAAIRALLELPNRIGELLNRHLGVVVFVRADYVQAAVRQNVGQLLQRFQAFRLLWNPESFLRLAFMLSCQAGIGDSDIRQAESLRIEELKDKLEKLWGKKLGNEKSKEAHSARWVYAALCDLKGNVQARDLVRFLKFAAEGEVGRPSALWPDRVLAPESMRRAIPDCSQEKVNEAKSEIAPLRRWVAQMDEQGIRSLRVPFSQQDAALDPHLLSALQDLGVIYEDNDPALGDERLFLPEIYRHGLGFETSATGRPRTQALLKKNIGSIPL